jgi:hypothetical protein
VRIGRLLVPTLALLFPGGLAARQPPADSVTVVPGAQYKAGALHRLFFGSRYRALWTTPIRVPVLDLGTYAGGLRPTERGGGLQTRSLRLAGGDGREYQFRSLAKDPTVILPPELRETLAADILQDQMSSAHPAGALIVAPLLDSVGVLHSRPVLVQMPDTPALGEFRAEFAGLLGTLEERPRGRNVESTEDLFDRLEEDPLVRVDARAFLLARLTDVFVGDWDRHADQWRWERADTGGPPRWLPIPRDRDQAFVRFDGFLLMLARQTAPQLQDFGPEYGNMVGATWNGRELDRRLLSELERPVWDSLVAVLKARLTDGAIRHAVSRMPPEFLPHDGARLVRALLARRDALDDVADRYYRMLAAEVEVIGSDAVDSAVVSREHDGSTRVTLSSGGTVYFNRRFTPRETREVRIHLHGGDDRSVVQAARDGAELPKVRVIGGGGDDRFLVADRSGIRLYDDRGDNQAEGAGINRSRWRWQPDSAHPVELWPRDWGHKTTLLPLAGYNPDLQAILGYGGFTDWFAFRREPFGTRMSYRLELATGRFSGRGALKLTRMVESRKRFYSFELLGSGIEILRWYGFGNETPQDESVSFYRVGQTLLSAAITLGHRFGPTAELDFGPVASWSHTDLESDTNADRFIALDRPYGTDGFRLVGLRGRLALDTRDHPHFASRGAAISLEASAYPSWADAEETIRKVSAQASIALSPPGRWRPSLHLMAGGVKTWGRLPFFLAPTLGGTRTLRGYRPDRFAGEASAYGAAELRIPLTRLGIVVPGEQGVFGFYDVGRVFVRGEQSDEWHSAVGGGVWLSFLSRNNVVYVGAGKPTRDAEGVRFVLGFGFPH